MAIIHKLYASIPFLPVICICWMVLRLAENIQIIIYLMCQESNAQTIGKIRSWAREIVLSHIKEHPEHFLMQTSINKSNTCSKDMLDCFINIYVHTELGEWPYLVNSATVCKCMVVWCLSTYNVLFSTLKCLLTMIQQL